MKDWFLPAMAALLTWAFWAFLPKIAVKYMEFKSATFYQIMGGLIVGIGILFATRFQLVFNWPGFSYNIIIGILGFLGVFFYLITVSRGPISVVAPITAMYPIIVVILGVTLLHETLTPKQGLGIFSPGG